MTAIYNQLPSVLGDIVAKNLHELNMADVLSEFHELDMAMLRLEIIMQHYASQGRIRIIQFSGGKVGQEIHLIHPITDDGNDMSNGNVGRSWNIFDEREDEFMNWWRKSGVITESDPEYHYTYEDWYDYSNWNINYGDGLSRVRIMLQHIPDHPDFDEIDDLNTGENFVSKYPNFIPIFITVPTNCISKVEVHLNTIQLSIKHGFKQSATIISSLLNSTAVETQSQLHEIFGTIMEHLIMHPAILIYAPHFRFIFYQKLDELRKYINEHLHNAVKEPIDTTTPFYIKYTRIEQILHTMDNVMRGIRSDPEFVH